MENNKKMIVNTPTIKTRNDGNVPTPSYRPPCPPPKQSKQTTDTNNNK